MLVKSHKTKTREIRNVTNDNLTFNVNDKSLPTGLRYSIGGLTVYSVRLAEKKREGEDLETSTDQLFPLHRKHFVV